MAEECGSLQHPSSLTSAAAHIYWPGRCMLCGHGHRGEAGIPECEYFHLDVDIFTFPPLPCYSPSGMFPPVVPCLQFPEQSKSFSTRNSFVPKCFSFGSFYKKCSGFQIFVKNSPRREIIPRVETETLLSHPAPGSGPMCLCAHPALDL